MTIIAGSRFLLLTNPISVASASLAKDLNSNLDIGNPVAAACLLPFSESSVVVQWLGLNSSVLRKLQ